MGSRPEINQFIAKMTEANTARLSKLNNLRTIFNDAYGPFAFCNRKLVNAIEQDDVQRKALQELIHYIAKVNEYYGKHGVFWKHVFYYLEKIFSAV